MQAICRQLGDVLVPLVGDDRLAVVVQILFHRSHNFFQLLAFLFRWRKLRKRLFIPLEQFDKIPSFPRGLKLSLKYSGNFFQCRFDLRTEFIRKAERFLLLRKADRRLRRPHRSRTLQRGCFDDFAAQGDAELLRIDPILGSSDDVHHVQCDNNRNSKLHDLCRQIQVPFQIGRVYQIDDGIRLFVQQVIAADNFLQCVRGKRIDSRQVGDDDILVASEFPFLFFDRNARPVADILAAARQVVEHGRLAAVRVAGERDFYSHL